ncbi:MAG: ribosome biogenesis GTP-binding protein YihA/YsxC [Prevotellaceae bacterium]|jgi:GTP-binding protein|nr:ribosome biogenesis GTP-binding protein YihA/YsxC [Prevotellaceae bacterium]
MIIKSAEFITSSQTVEQCPRSNFPEYAFVGRSNVGKSSLINKLVNRKNLAHTSSTPGKTQLINHYLINSRWHLVDLPGYGYARSSKAKRAQFAGSITGYIAQRDQLTLLFVLLDSRLEPQPIDLDFITRLGEWRIPFALIFTKADKLTKAVLQKNITHYQNTLLTEWDALPPVFVTSAETGAGRDELLTYIEMTNSLQALPKL